MIARIRDVDIPRVLHQDSRGSEELTIASTSAAPLEQKMSPAVEFADAVAKLRAGRIGLLDAIVRHIEITLSIQCQAHRSHQRTPSTRVPLG